MNLKSMKNTILTVTLIAVTYVELFAQGAPPATPIDGGLSLLLVAGGAYGLKKIKDSRKR